MQEKNPKPKKLFWKKPNELLSSSNTKSLVFGALIQAFLAALSVSFFCFLIASKVGNAISMPKEQASWEDPRKSSKDDPEQWIHEIKTLKKHGSLFASLDQMSATKTVAPAGEKAPAKVQPHNSKKSKTAAATPKSDLPKDRWEELYGSASSQSEGINYTMGLSSGGSETALVSQGVSKGYRIQVRLKGDAASSPAGPATAVVTREIKINQTIIPRGTEIYGESSGSAPGARLLMQFELINMPDQAPIRISGRALAIDGRVGIPGKNILGGGSDIAASAIGSAISASGNLISGFIGGSSNPLGAAVQGATSPTASKADRLNRAEEAIVVENGARFQIYVDSIDG